MAKTTKAPKVHKSDRSWKGKVIQETPVETVKVTGVATDTSSYYTALKEDGMYHFFKDGVEYGTTLKAPRFVTKIEEKWAHDEKLAAEKAS